VREIRRLLHDFANVLTSALGFMDLALGEADRSKRYEYMMRSRRELRRATKLASELRVQVEAKASLYGEGSND
jgi:hypothetical protein